MRPSESTAGQIRSFGSASGGSRQLLKARALRWLVYLGAATTAVVLVFLIGHIVVSGVPYLKPSLFEWEYTSTNVSLVPALVNTLIMSLFALLLAVPIGVGSAIYLVEYAPRGSR